MKVRKWWLIPWNVGGWEVRHQPTEPNKSFIEVIEYSAYETVVKELDELKAFQMQDIYAAHRELINKAGNLQSKYAKATAALRAIAQHWADYETSELTSEGQMARITLRELGEEET